MAKSVGRVGSGPPGILFVLAHLAGGVACPSYGACRVSQNVSVRVVEVQIPLHNYFCGSIDYSPPQPQAVSIPSTAAPMSRPLSNHFIKTSGIISLALLLLGGLGVWQSAGGSVSGTGEKPGVFADGIAVTFAPHSEQSGIHKRAGERPPAGDDDNSLFWLVSRTPHPIATLLSELIPAGAAHRIVSSTAPYSPQLPRAPPLT